MKKLTVLSFIICSIISAKSSFAQSGFGIRGGVNFSQIYTNSSVGTDIKQSLDTKTGYSFGIWGRIGKKIFVQPEVLLTTRGGTIDVVPVSNPNATPIAIDVKYTQFDVPILLGYQPAKFIHFMAGPVASLKISEDQSIKDALTNYTKSLNYTTNSATWGYQVGVGIHLLGFDLDLRREGGLSDVSVLNLQNNQSAQRTSGWQLSLAMKFI